jgi:hypothetical protein
MIEPEDFVEEAVEKIARVIGAFSAPGPRQDRMVDDAVLIAKEELWERYGDGAVDLPALVDELRRSLTDTLLRLAPAHESRN